jgi:hypothetical protein
LGVAGVAGVAVASLARENNPLKTDPHPTPSSPSIGRTGSGYRQHVHMNSAYFILYVLYAVIELLESQVAKPRWRRCARIAGDFEPEHGRE